MGENIKYVAGFLFDQNCHWVILIKKNRPDWQAGKLNAIGGHIEEGESSLEAMIREFKEEAGVVLKDWKSFAVLHDKRNYRVEFFYAVDEDAFISARNVTDELLHKVVANKIDGHNTIPNLNWLVPMALSMVDEVARKFEIIEIA